MTSPENIFVFWSDGSPPCMSILIALEEKQLQGYKHKCISFERQEHKSAEVMELNPRGQMPTCKIGDLVLCESLAVCKYLEEKNHGRGTSLSYHDAERDALMWQKLSEFYWNFPRLCYKDYVRYFWDTKPEDRHETEIKRKRLAFIKEIKIWEEHFKKMSKDGPYVMGAQFTLADVIIFPWIAFLVALSLDLKGSSLDHMNNYYTTLMLRPSIVSTFPKHWDGSTDRSVLKDMCQYLTGSNV